MSAHIVLTSHTPGRGDKAAHTIRWGAATPQERGPIVASVSAGHHRNAIGTHSGAYAITKAGVLLLSRQLAVEWGPSGVRSNTLCPGMTWTHMTEAAYSRPGEAELRSSAIPMRRIGQAQDMADAVVFLASNRSSYVNGADLVVDGGFTRNLMSMIPRTAS